MSITNLDHIEGLLKDSQDEDVLVEPDESAEPEPCEQLYELMKLKKHMMLRTAQREELPSNAETMASLKKWWNDSKAKHPPSSPWKQLRY